MNSLSLDKPLLLITVGYPGAGKSAFATQFSDMFSAPMVSYNQLRYLLFAEPTYGTAEQAILQNIANTQVAELLKTKKTFIVDGGGNIKSERLKLQNMAKAAGYGTLTIWVQTDLATSKDRATKRSNKAIDMYRLPITLEQFDAQVKKLTPPGAAEERVVISGKHTFSTQAKVVLKRLVAAREAAVATLPKAERPAQPETPVLPIKPKRTSVFIN